MEGGGGCNRLVRGGGLNVKSNCFISLKMHGPILTELCRNHP